MAEQFPPAPWADAFTQIAIYDALYSNQLQNVPNCVGSPATHVHRGVPHTGGIVGKMSGAVFGSPSSENQSAISIPVAGDLAQLSADMLFAESPAITLPPAVDTPDAEATPERKAAQARLDKIMSSDEAHAELLRSGEYSAAHGVAYLAIVWDKDEIDHVWFRAFRADCAIPEFRYQRLSAVALWTDYQRKEDTYRLLERHSKGFITYQLWKGTSTIKGAQVPIDTIPETEH
ncbi:hypothetical protein [Microterricola viridarii]|uniref:hypothetical protein n=1 Tax=Microterricola viridarii TaxID=412690 RepID=UPI0012EA3401|nr:hypothetical protein [Microterricola viridarii]